ncbi:MAG: polyprenyl synthetase family protein [Candidatus Micrarchaeaceae archaeon]|jgi:geranylgeranyl pyrophosphate synthase
MANNDDIVAYMKERAVDIDKKIDETLTNKDSARYFGSLLGRSGYEYDLKAINKAVIDPAKYLLSLGGKRWRPVLMLTVIDAIGKDSNNFIEFSIIPEVIHNGSLIHDDIEDNSDMRRGAPAVHKKYGVDIALNLGDFMFYFPMVALLDSKKLTKEIKIKVLDIYQREMLKLTIGQATDIAWHNSLVDYTTISESQYMQMAYSKTGVLSGMAAKLGAALAEADDNTIDTLGKFGSSIGVAFQLQDDLLNITENQLSVNKGFIGEDITEGKVTLMVIHALSKANEQDKKRLEEILAMHTKDQEIINEAIAIIKKYGAIEYVKELEYTLVKDAWANVEKRLNDSEPKKKLKAMVEYLIDRSI